MSKYMRTSLDNPIRRARPWLALAVVIAAALATASSALADRGRDAKAFVPPPLAAAAHDHPKQLFKVIVAGKRGTPAAAVAAEQSSAISNDPAAGSRVRKHFLVATATSSTLSGKQIEKLARNPKVVSIVEDGATRSLGLGSPLPAPLYSNTQTWPVEAEVSNFWTSSLAVPTIAVIDSGVDASRVADFGGRVIADANIVTSGPNTADGDGWGHGTLVASIAAGAAPGFAGAAPTANIVSVDVLDDAGAGVVSELIDGLDWVYRNKDAYGIKVVNMSVLAGGPASFMYDAIDQAVEKLWMNGVVVVTAAGNYGVNGEPSGVLYAPANDPFVISVGAADPGATTAAADDFNAPWSAYGYTPDGFSKPELGAIGRYMNGAVPPTATMYKLLPERVLAPGYMWMSGTSFAAPVVAGVSAHLVAKHPEWSPDQIKGALMLTAAQYSASAGARSLGVGMAQASQAAAVSDPPNPNEALNKFVVTDPNGNRSFDTTAWSAAADADPTWASASWSSASWSSASWSSASWSSASWSSASWSSASWSSASWSSASWSSASWSSASWAS